MIGASARRKGRPFGWIGVACVLWASAQALADSSIHAGTAGTAMQYARACQNGAWDAVMDMTAWMRDRLDCAGSGSEGRDAIKKELQASLARKTAEGNRLRPEGIEDVYLFAPTAMLRVVRTDSGRADLDRPACGRAWMEVVYPVRAQAPRDEQGRAIRKMVVGVNVACDELILKANVVGNMEVEPDSMAYYPGER